MKCPLIAIGLAITEDQHWLQDSGYLKEECAWWDKIQEKCGVLSLCHDIHFLVVAAQQIRDKMPPLGNKKGGGSRG